MTEQKDTHYHHSMLSVEDAFDRIVGSFNALEVEFKSARDAVGQVLAEDISSPLDIPALDNSAMDGYAIQADSIKGASESSLVILKVVGSVAAGEMPKDKVVRGTAVRIMTGAPMPPGADSVVPFEETDEHDRRTRHHSMGEIGIRRKVESGNSVRPAGQDVVKGQKVLSSGKVIRPAEVGVLSSMGFSKVPVVRRPVVAILATGDELVEPGLPLSPGKIYDSNSSSITAAVQRAGGVAKPVGIAKDNLESLNHKIDEGLQADMLITSAGVSKGDYDIVKDVLAQRGEIEIWSVRMRPAKPLAFGLMTRADGKQIPHLGLPGNPVSAMVAFEQFGEPAIRKMLGLKDLKRPTIEAILDDDLHNSDGRRVYARVVVSNRDGAYHARLTGAQGSNLLTSMARANGLAICPENISVRRAGEIVTVQMIDWPPGVFWSNISLEEN